MSQDDSMKPIIAGEPAATDPAIDLPEVESPALGAAHDEAPKIEAPKIEIPKSEIPKPEKPTISFRAPGGSKTFHRPEDAPLRNQITIAGPKPRIVSPTMMLAASIAIAAVFGSVVGAVTSATFLRPAEPAPVAANSNAMKTALTQLSADITAIKSDSKVQIAQLSQRIDRAEKAQAEPFAKIAKVTEAVDRLEKRALASSEATGSIGAAANASAAAAPAAAAKLPQRAIAEGWTLRDVNGNRALIENRTAIYQVIPGSLVPGLGRIESIKREDGRWVIVTPKGLIVSAR